MEVYFINIPKAMWQFTATYGLNSERYEQPIITTLLEWRN